MDDLISRQQAIDALDVLCQEHRYKIPGKRETYSQYNEAWQDALDRAEGSIFNLPTVQPEKAQLSKEGTTSDLISRTEVVEHLRRVLEATVPNTDYDEGYIDGIEFGISIVTTMPPAQPEPQEGYWIRTDCGLDVECKCSKCGYRDFVEPRDEYWFKRNYCPNCGAKMTISTK